MVESDLKLCRILLKHGYKATLENLDFANRSINREGSSLNLFTIYLYEKYYSTKELNEDKYDRFLENSQQEIKETPNYSMDDLMSGKSVLFKPFSFSVMYRGNSSGKISGYPRKPYLAITNVRNSSFTMVKKAGKYYRFDNKLFKLTRTEEDKTIFNSVSSESFVIFHHHNSQISHIEECRSSGYQYDFYF